MNKKQTHKSKINNEKKHMDYIVKRERIKRKKLKLDDKTELA